jgi:flagellar biosynthesis/type III secretory pathway chaperone
LRADGDFSTLAESASAVHSALLQAVRQQVAAVHQVQKHIDSKCEVVHKAAVSNQRALTQSQASFKQLKEVHAAVKRDEALLEVRAAQASTGASLDRVQQLLAFGKLALH